MELPLHIITNLDDLYEDEPDTLATIFKSIKKIDSNEETINAIFRNENSLSNYSAPRSGTDDLVQSAIDQDSESDLKNTTVLESDLEHLPDFKLVECKKKSHSDRPVLHKDT